MRSGGHHRAGGAGRGGRLLAAALLAAVAAASAQDRPVPGAAEPLVYRVTLNGADAGDAVLLRLEDGRLLASEADWDRWHLVRPTAGYRHGGQAWFALDAAPGFAAALDAPRQEASLQFAPRAFVPSVLGARPTRRFAPQPPPGRGGFLNYDFVGTHQSPRAAPATSTLNGIVEAGLFDPMAVLISQWLGRDLANDGGPGFAASAGRDVVRLDTALTHDRPDTMETLRFGDGAGAAGLWGRPVRYGGLRWTRNFATQPGFVALPQPSLSGETALPSVIDVYVDGLRRGSLEVPAGPFVVENLPTLTGQGEVQVVVRDLLGREQLISDSYMTGVQQLRAGLHDFSWELGYPRERYGELSNEYGTLFAATTHRYGFSDALTGEARLELGEDFQAGGAGAIFPLRRLGVVSAALAASHGDRGAGALGQLGLQHSSRRALSLGVRLQLASPDFVQAGLAPGARAPRRSISANAGYFVRGVGRFGLGYVARAEAAPIAEFEAVTAGYTTSYRRATLALLAIERLAPQRELAAGFTLSMAFGGNHTGSTGHRQRDADDGAWSSQSYASLQRNLSEQEDWGYRLRLGEDHDSLTGSATSAEAGVGLNARYGSYGLEAATYDEAETYRGTVSGGLGTLAGHVFASRKLARSFAVVEAGAAGIELLVNNRVAGRTNADGVAVLPYLQPYQANVVSVDATNVPLDVEVRNGEFRAAPYYRSGVLIPLDVRRTRSAVLTLVQADGTLVPAGAIGRIAPAGEPAPVAKGGKLYVSGLAPRDNVVDVRWNHHRCQVTFDLPADAVQPELGPLTCRDAPP